MLEWGKLFNSIRSSVLKGKFPILKISSFLGSFILRSRSHCASFRKRIKTSFFGILLNDDVTWRWRVEGKVFIFSTFSWLKAEANEGKFQTLNYDIMEKKWWNEMKLLGLKITHQSSLSTANLSISNNFHRDEWNGLLAQKLETNMGNKTSL